MVPPVQYMTGKKFDTSPGTRNPVDSITITDSDDSSDGSELDSGEDSSQNVSCGYVNKIIRDCCLWLC